MVTNVKPKIEIQLVQQKSPNQQSPISPNQQVHYTKLKSFGNKKKKIMDILYCEDSVTKS